MSNKKIIALRLSGPMQSWGYNSEYIYRNSGLFPTKSAVLGMCCAANGLPRGTEQEKQFLERLTGCLMTAIALPRCRSAGEKNWEVYVRRIEDFHTVENTKTASGKFNKNAVMTYRQYLCDADFMVLLENIEESIADQLEINLNDPEWGMWLGRKSCIPTAPVFAGKFDTIEKACQALLKGKKLNAFTYQQEVLSFAEGIDSLMDEPLDYAVDKRDRVLRRVKVQESEKIG
jgi:CRISPR system Cascade subunit CasD